MINLSTGLPRKLKTLSLAFLLFFSIQVSANKPVEETPVNFFTLAANTEALDGQRVSIVGWMKFIEYDSEKSVRLFHSESSLNLFRVDESILVRIPVEDFDAAKDYLDLKFVTVYAKYSASKSIGSLGELTEVKDIDIKTSE